MLTRFSREKYVINNTKHVLVVDDVPAICSLLADFLEANGYPVKIATTAENACELLAKLKFSLLIADRHLDEAQSCGGFEVIDCARSTQPPTPVIAISGSISQEAANQLVDLPLKAFFTKPLNLERLLRTIAHLNPR